jgi:small subunit ribosomal protein S17
MAKKKTEEVEETTAEVSETGATEEIVTESNEVSSEASADENAEAVAVESEDKPKKASKKAKEADAEEPSIIDSVVATVSSAVETVAEAVVGGVETIVSAVTGDSGDATVKTSKRAEKIGVVSSDKMTKTVTVRVDRLVKHPIYRKYIKRRKKFMAHDEMGAAIGDKVRIVETRPLSAKKRWRVVEIIQKAER